VKWLNLCAPAAGCFAVAGILLASCAAAERPPSEWVYAGGDGKLVYRTTERGDRIMDFSHAGYMGGGVALPDVAVARTVAPTDGDDDAAVVQSAVDEVAALPLVGGFRGAVLLEPGVYRCERAIEISASGVVLRGSGATEDSRSTLLLTGRPHAAVVVRGGGEGRRGRRRDGDEGRPGPSGDDDNDEQRFETTIADDYVPSGTTTLTVNDATGLAVGDWVAIRKPVTRAWIEFMQMHDLMRDGDRQTWLRTGQGLNAERQIAAIDGNTLTLDVPLSDSIDAQFLGDVPADLDKISPPGRLSQVGVENLHIESPPQPFSHSRSHFTALRINGQDCWVRDVAIDETMNSVSVGGRRVTLQRVSITRTALHEGSSRPAEFAPNGTQVLMDRCTVTADNVWFVATGGRVSGPMVLLNCTFHGDSRAESHQRWSTGLLYDNCRAADGAIELRNRGSMGSGHGWSMGWGVAWNCTAREFIVQSAPGAPNWMIGCVGESRLAPRPFGTAPNLPEGIKDSPEAPVAPVSLYLAQLAERLGPEALENLGYESADNIE
jgi:hypothetical protein